MIVTYFENNEIQMTTFREYFLSESVKPQKIDYGWNDYDYNDKIIKTFQTRHITKFYSSKTKEYYAVLVRETNKTPETPGLYEVVFSNFNKESKTVTPDDPMTSKGSALSIFSNVFYVVLEMIKKLNLKNISFNGYTPALDAIYSKLTKNKFFLKELKEIGFEYKGKTKEDYIFEKV